MATERTITIGRLALPYLVACAQKRETITYGKLAKLVGSHHRAIRYAIGYIRDEICRARGLPMLTAIVVNQDSHEPGDNFLPEGTAHLSPAEYTHRFEQLRDDVFACQDWDRLLAELDLTPIEKTPEDFDQEGREYNKSLARRQNHGEGDGHRQLKHYVAQHPEVLGVSTVGKGTMEFAFVSGDECDVVFQLRPTGEAVVEIKNGERGELIKGVYQAVKYRALMIAQRGHGGPYAEVKAFLVAYQIPEDIVKFAGKFNIECVVVPEPIPLD